MHDHPFSSTPITGRPLAVCEPARLERLPASTTHGLACWLAIPQRLDPSLPPLVAVHGVRRGARNQARQFMDRAAAQGRLVIAPLFDEQHWAGYQRVAARGQRADVALLRALEVVAFLSGVRTRQVQLFGYSGGAQFVHRFALLHPHRVDHLCVCAAGWYTWPADASQAFPHGLGASLARGSDLGQLARQHLNRFLQLPIQVAVGEHDAVPDALTRRDPALDAVQGTHRLERARRWVQQLHRLAGDRGLPSLVRLAVLPGAGHDFRQCMASGALAALAMPPPLPAVSDQRSRQAA
jgi:pimeloyl-ACP methyl ester carboxylesterase